MVHIIYGKLFASFNLNLLLVARRFIIIWKYEMTFVYLQKNLYRALIVILCRMLFQQTQKSHLNIAKANKYAVY